MKEKFILSTIFALLIVFPLVSADLIPENSHPLSRCVKFVNLNEFPEIILIGYYTGPGADWVDQNLYVINQSMCLTKGYKFR